MSPAEVNERAAFDESERVQRLARRRDVVLRNRDPPMPAVYVSAGLGVLRTDEYNCTNCNYEYFGFMVLPNLQEAFWFNFYLILMDLYQKLQPKLILEEGSFKVTYQCRYCYDSNPNYFHHQSICPVAVNQEAPN
ncbi:unnamed protein product [Caenorhabditis nigoni]